MSESFSVVMTGKIAEGQDLEQVKANVARLFKLGDAQLGKMFSGRPVAVRKGISRDQADKICAALLQAGAEAKVKAGLPQADAKPEPQKPSPMKVVSNPNPVSPAARVAGDADAEKPRPTAVKAVPSPSAEDSFKPDLECPRCGHEQSFATQCGLCKMDLTLHIQRLQRKEKARALRRQVAG